MSLLTTAAMRDRLEAVDVRGVTVVTHGFQLGNSGGDSLMPLANAIREQADGWLLDYDISGQGGEGAFEVNPNVPGEAGAASSGEAVLLFDWAPESNELTDGWGDAAGDALFNLLVGLDFVRPADPSDSKPLHFIGHSFGTAVTSEAVERLAAFEISVDHVTYLDPHDFDQGLIADSAQRLFELGQPEGYGAAVWDKVRFSDVYYQTRGLNGALVLDKTVPDGRPIPGAYNVLLDTELPPESPNPYGPVNVSGDHTYAWNGYYLATVTGTWPNDVPQPATSFSLTETGYAFSRVADGAEKRERNPAEFFGDLGGEEANDAHEHSSELLVSTLR